jgi:hypothetical protein
MLETVKHLGSITTDKYIVITFEKVVISDKPDEKDSGFYITALDRNNSADTKDVYSNSRAEKIENTTGCIELSSLAENKGAVTWVFSEHTRNGGYRLCFGLYFKPGDFRTCKDNNSFGRVRSISIEYFNDGRSIICWDEQDPCGCGSSIHTDAH